MNLQLNFHGEILNENKFFNLGKYKNCFNLEVRL